MRNRDHSRNYVPAVLENPSDTSLLFLSPPQPVPETYGVLWVYQNKGGIEERKKGK